MKILLYILLFQYCHKWNCINNKLGLPDELPTRDLYRVVLKGLLPDGPWQDVVEKTLDGCYGNRTRRYTNTCPGQALAHCVVDQLIENCPAESLSVKDGCSPVSSLAGLNYMFSQSRYHNLVDNISKERRPEWFLNHYFSTKCCDLPKFFDMAKLTMCGFTEMMHTFAHAPQLDKKFISLHASNVTATNPPIILKQRSNPKLNIVDLNAIPSTVSYEDLPDPLQCCDVSEFIKSSFKEECSFELSWQGQKRLVVNNNTVDVTTVSTTTTRPASLSLDVYISPQSCEKETCVFKKLNIVSDNGTVNREAYLKFLDNFTTAYPAWTKPKARVITTCLTKPSPEYEADCDINKVLACTFDVLTENCPFRSTKHSCKHKRDQSYPDFCQISTSKYRPKHRRELCKLPEFVSKEVLSSCGIDAISAVQPATEARASKPRSNLWLDKYTCKNLTPSAKCVLNKMGVLNKYGFMDYFKMKDAIRQFTTGRGEWDSLQEAYLSAFLNMPLYTQHCNSARKLLNVLDSMLLTCPASKRSTTPQCTKLFAQISNTIPENLDKLNHFIIKHFHHVFMPEEPVPTYKNPVIRNKRVRKINRNLPYNYGILNSRYAPSVNVINVKPEVKRPLVLLPVYLRLPDEKRVVRPFNNDGVWRRQPFALHNQIAMAHANSTVSPISTVSSTSTVSPITTNE